MSIGKYAEKQGDNKTVQGEIDLDKKVLEC